MAHGRRNQAGRRAGAGPVASAQVGAPEAPSFTPVAGLARSLEGETADVMGGQQVPDDVGTVLRRRAGRGSPLARSVAGDLGERLGADFSQVRVHADPEADTIARSLQATAFTLGSDIYFSSGTYAPGTKRGDSLLAHELTHVRQHQRGGASSSGGLGVGRVDDPAEREAEQVARQVTSGAEVCSGADGGHAGHVHRSPRPDLGTVRRLFGIFGASGVGQARTKEVKTDDEEVPTAFVDLADTITAMKGVPDLVGKGVTGSDVWEKSNGLMGTEGGYGTNAAIGGVGAIKQFVGSGFQAKEGVDALRDGYKHDDSISKNLGAVKIESATWGVLSGGGGVLGVVQNAGKQAGQNMPVLDVGTNVIDTVSKGKKAIEDSTASWKLGRQKVRAKRDADQFLPQEVRAKRFGDFANEMALGSKGKVKSSDRKRWPDVKKKWNGDPRNTTGLDPLTADWTTSPLPAPQVAFLVFLRGEGKDFGYGTKGRDTHDTALKNGTGPGRGTDAQADEDADNYQDLRNMKKVGKFGQVRKADTATTNAIESAGSALDAAGTFTAAGDMGATKATGKAMKALSSLYKGIKSIVKRVRRVHRLRVAKNEMAYGNKAERGVIWGLKQFLVGNVDKQQEHAREALSNAVEKRNAYALALEAHDRSLKAWQTEMDKYTDYLRDKGAWDADKDLYDKELATYDTELEEYEKAKADYETRKKAYDEVMEKYEAERSKVDASKKAFMSQPSGQGRGKVMEHLWAQHGDKAPEKPTDQDPGSFDKVAPTKPTDLRKAPDLVDDPTARKPQIGAAPTTGDRAKSSKVMTDAEVAKLMKRLTIQCDRKINDMLAALGSSNDRVLHRARRIMHVIAETNLAGAIQKIDDADLEKYTALYQKQKKGTALTTDEQKDLDRRSAAIRAIIKHQLSGIGG